MGGKQSRQKNNNTKNKKKDNNSGDMNCEQLWAQHGINPTNGQPQPQQTNNLKMNVQLVPISWDQSRPVAILL